MKLEKNWFYEEKCYIAIVYNGWIVEDRLYYYPAKNISVNLGARSEIWQDKQVCFITVNDLIFEKGHAIYQEY